MYTLILGNKKYSSWSLRGWLMLAPFGVPFVEKVVPMYTQEFQDARAPGGEMAPSRTVPTLICEEDGARQVIWDSLAMAEFLAERHPEAGHWPTDPAQRATARCLAAEMHSSFTALRSNMPMNLHRSFPGRGWTEAVGQDIARMAQLWEYARETHGISSGPYLFGERFSAVDAMFTPVALRLEAYDAPTPSDAAAAYVKALQNAPKLDEWRAAAAQEPWVERRYDYD